MANIRINKTFGPYKEGQVVRVDTDADGVPLEAYWRRRLQDAQTDGCCEMVQPKAAATSRKAGNSEKE